MRCAPATALLLACLCLSWTIATISAEAAPDWQVGVASVKITPQKPVALAGYASRTKPFEAVDQEIYAKALALKDVEGNRAVLITMDLCILPKEVGEGVRARIAAAAHIDLAAVVLNVAHSHSAPAVSLQTAATTGPATRSVNAANDATVEYTRWLQDRLVDVAAQALDHLEPAQLSWGTGVAHFAMNRRQFTDKGVILGVNPSGLADRSVPVLRIDSAEGKLRAVLLGYACHNTTTPSGHLGVNGDYAGYTKAYIQQQLPGVEAMFMIGCAGDANPYPRQQMTDAPAHGETLGKEVCRMLTTKLVPIHGPLQCAAVDAELPLQAPARGELLQMTKAGAVLNKEAAKQMLAHLDGGASLPKTYRAPVAAWQFGKDLTLIGLPDEVVVDYVTRLQETLGPLRLWVAGYCNEVTGYIPSDRVLREGGYETRGLYIETGLFTPGVESALVNAARDAAVKAGRELPPSAH